MKSISKILCIAAIFLCFFGCQKGESPPFSAPSEPLLTLPEGETLPDGITMSQDQLKFYFSFKKSTQNASRIKNFHEIKKDLEFFVSLSQKYRTELENSDYPFFSVIYKEKLKLLSGFLDEFSLMPTEMASLNRIDSAFSETPYDLDLIVMYPGRVSFDTNNRLYALVYTEDDSVPKYMTWPKEVEEKRRILVEKIEPHWYHVFKD